MSSRQIRGEASSPPIRVQIGGDAYPTSHSAHPGLSALDYFAGQAAPAYLDVGLRLGVSADVIAANVYDFAEELLRERDTRRAQIAADIQKDGKET